MENRLRNCVVACVLLLCCWSVVGKEIQGKDAMGRDYWLYLPDEIDPEKRYTLVVGVHGAGGNGKGAAGYAGWAKRHDVIVLGCSYRYPGGAYQYLQNNTDLQTIELFAALKKQYKLRDKLFIGGFSGGSQYAHRFAMKYPDLVAGCAAHSGGTWGTGDYPPGEPVYLNPKAKGVLFVISCGEKDTQKSFGQAPLGRLDWAKKYERLLDQGGFIYDARWWPDVGHGYSKGARRQTEDCFVASTKRLPEYEAERDALKQSMRARAYAEAWSIVRARFDHPDKDDDGIIGKLHRAYVASLDESITRIDRLAEREVRKIVRMNDDPQARRAALEAHKAQFDGAPKTSEAVDRALAELDRPR